MRLITIASNAAEAAQRWKQQYFVERTGEWKSCFTDPELVHRKLIALGDSPPPEAVDAIIGNSSWTRLDTQCGECGQRTDPIIQIGQEPDYESHTAYVCRDCLKAALDLLA